MAVDRGGQQVADAGNRVNALGDDRAGQAAEDAARKKLSYPEPFERLRRDLLSESKSPYQPKYPQRQSSERTVPDLPQRQSAERTVPDLRQTAAVSPASVENIPPETMRKEPAKPPVKQPIITEKFEQQNLFDEKLLSRENVPEHKLIGQIFDTYWMVQFRDNLYIIDQHAAHERIFYEEFTGHYLQGQKFSQPVLTPFTISVSADVYYMSRDWLDPLTDAGFEIEDFGADSFIVRAIPSYMDISEAESFARSYLEGLGEVSGRNDIVIDKLILRSCKAAVKANDHLSRMEIDDLIRRLSACSDPYCCPHGRPTFIRYTRYELERSFRRK